MPVDDPIFDPWSIDEPPQQGRPGELLPDLESANEPATGQPRWSRSTCGEWVPNRRARSRPVPRPLSTSEASHPEPNALPGVVPASAAALLLRDLLVPRLDSLSSRLELAGHSTVMDQRLAEAPPSVRFRLTPRRGAFEDPEEAVPASVLEVLLDESEPTVSGRFWLDPLAESPATQISAKTDQVDLAWIDRLLINFVEKALRVI